MSASNLTFLKLKIPLDMKAKLRREASRRGITMQSLVREQLVGLTGVPDPTRRYRRRTQKRPPSGRRTASARNSGGRRITQTDRHESP
jgi:hypothetical protein